MKVALLTIDFPPGMIGGVSAWSHDMAWALHRAGHSVDVYAKTVGDTCEHDDTLPFNVTRVRGRSWARWGSLWMGLATQRRLMAYDLVLSASWALCSKLKPHPRLCVAFHGSEITTLQEAPTSLRALSARCHRLFPVSEFLQRELIRLGCLDDSASRSTVLPMPLSLDTQPQTQRGSHLICVARPTDRKGIDRAIAIAKATGRTLKLIGPKSGPPGTEAYGILPRQQTLKEVASAHAILLTPRPLADGRGGEGLGLCLLEAASLGVPAIGCDTGGVAEALGPGLLLNDPDHPDGPAINAWLAQSDRGAEALAWVQTKHGPTRAVETLEAVLR